MYSNSYELKFPKLTSKQCKSIDLVVQGQSDAEVARLIGVKRETVNRWRHHDSAYSKAVEVCRKQLVAPCIERIDGRIDDDLEHLVEAFHKYLPKKHCRLAMSYIKLLRDLG